MKLSEAIRLGAMLRPQGFGRLHGNGKTCALGAAMSAAGWSEEDLDKSPTTVQPSFFEAFPILSKRVTVPEKGHERSLWYAISLELNDSCRWTRERIADWVETIEPNETEARHEAPCAIGSEAAAARRAVGAPVS